MLALEGLSRHFGGLKVIENLDLTVERGEVLGILGPNGAGKSTLFNLIAGVLPPSSGRVVYEGRDVTTVPVWKRCRAGVGRTYQLPKPFGQLSVFENVLVAAVHGGALSIAAGAEQASRVLSDTGLLHRSDWPARNLSLLDLKRLELAKALAQNPRLLLLDEIAGGLTEGECNELLAIIGRIRDSGTTIVWIEHVIHALRRVAGRMAVLYGGKIIVTGSPDEVLADQRVKEVYLGA